MQSASDALPSTRANAPHAWLEPRPAGAAPALVVGTMNFGKRTPEPESLRIVARGLERGLVFFDTANTYNDGESERILGRALAGKRDRCMSPPRSACGGCRRTRRGSRRRPSSGRSTRACAASGRTTSTSTISTRPIRRCRSRRRSRRSRPCSSKGRSASWGVSNYASWQILEMTISATHGDGAAEGLAGHVQPARPADRDRVPGVHATRSRSTRPCTTRSRAGCSRASTGTRRSPKGSRFDKNRMYQRRYWTERFFAQVDAIGADRARGEDEPRRPLVRVARGTAKGSTRSSSGRPIPRSSTRRSTPARRRSLRTPSPSSTRSTSRSRGRTRTTRGERRWIRCSSRAPRRSTSKRRSRTSPSTAGRASAGSRPTRRSRRCGRAPTISCSGG